MFSGISLSRKVIALSLLVSVGFLIMVAVLSFALQKEVIAVQKKSNQNMVQIVFAILSKYDEYVKKGDITLDEAQAQAVLIIRKIRFQSNEYIWINDTQPKMIMHSYSPELEGKDLSTFKDRRGKRIFAEILNVCRNGESGFVDCMWEKKGSGEAAKKRSYVSLFEPWGWIVGSGFFLEDIFQEVGMIRNIAISILILFILCLPILFYMISKSISQPINSATEGLARIGRDIAIATRQVSSSSHELSLASNRQAASLQETSASLEEMSTMTKQNADNAGQADILMKEATDVVGRANDSMTQLTSSMEEISISSVETSKIIKTIDEIAFQTNLLALNAAVEAARAGEAGAGFAVVADEVRNLASRSAEAAKSTAGLIEGTVRKIYDGSMIVSRTNDDFAEVARKASTVAGLVSEIAAASKEQSSGIDQIEKVVNEMEKVIQQNAANAQESDSSSQELKSQSDRMAQYINALEQVVHGATDESYRRPIAVREEHTGKGMDTVIRGLDSATAGIDSFMKRTKQKKKMLAQPDFKNPDDEDFADF